MRPLVAVTGASGAVGGRVAERLARQLASPCASSAGTPPGCPVCPARWPRPRPTATGRPCAGRSTGPTPCSWFGHEAAGRVREHITAVDAALAAGIERIVYVSFLGAAPDATFTFARDHWHTEEHVRGTELRTRS